MEATFLGLILLVAGVIAAFIFSLTTRQFSRAFTILMVVGAVLYIGGYISKSAKTGIGVSERWQGSWPNLRTKTDGRMVIGPTSFDDPANPIIWVGLSAGRFRIEVRGTIRVCTRCSRDTQLGRVSPNGVPGLPAISGSFPYPRVTPLSLVAQFRDTGEVIEIGGRADLEISTTRTVGFSMNDDVLEDNGGEGWTIIVTPY